MCGHFATNIKQKGEKTTSQEAVHVQTAIGTTVPKQTKAAENPPWPHIVSNADPNKQFEIQALDDTQPNDILMQFLSHFNTQTNVGTNYASTSTSKSWTSPSCTSQQDYEHSKCVKHAKCATNA